MAVGRSLVSRRRRAGDDEDEDGPVMVEDSQSEGSILSDADDGDDGSDADGEQSGQITRSVPELATQQSTASNGTSDRAKNGKSRKKGSKKKQTSSKSETEQTSFKASADTEAMMKGLQIDDTQDVIDFDADAGAQQEVAPVVSNGGQDKAKNEHEEYKKKRDADPAFIPNRGNFFMHDTRAQHGAGPLQFRGGHALRGRGRGTGANPFGPVPNGQRVERPSEQLWQHDLHESINEEPSAQISQNAVRSYPAQPQKPQSTAQSFSSTQVLGRVQLRVFLPGMAKPITYAEVPLKKYVRLPDHRPPLRRDKPVRIFLPNIGPKYIFPSTERSFIFIPRQMRPNHRGFGNTQQRSIGGYGYSSRRTSMYGGSVYSASVAASRRSSIARDRENMFSPGSYASGFQPPNRPVVRLPQGQFYPSSAVSPYSGQQTPGGQVHVYPLPQQPAFQGTPTTTVQHPRPQKAISVSGIESPAILSQRQTPGDQAFHSQLPMHVTEQAPQQNMPYYPQQYSGAQPTESPLGRIPEYTIHAQPFQPGQQQMFYSQYPNPQPPYFYPQMPMYMVPQQQPYVMPTNAPQQPPQSSQPEPAVEKSETQSQQAPSGMVAHESNGMVFYMPASEAAAQPSTTEQYQPAESFVPSYAVPGLPPTPASEQSGYYYMGMNGVQNPSYYPPMQQG